jgi:hypothetical protein
MRRAAPPHLSTSGAAWSILAKAVLAFAMGGFCRLPYMDSSTNRAVRATRTIDRRRRLNEVLVTA